MRLAQDQQHAVADQQDVRRMPTPQRVTAPPVDEPMSVAPEAGPALRLPTVSTAFVVTVVVVCLALGWLLPPLIGDATPLQMYWLVLPATIAGFRFGIPGAAVTSVVCWLVSGPLAP